MSAEPGTYAMDQRSGTLTVRTGRTGAIAKAGHDLTLEVQSWRASVQIGVHGVPTAMELTADGHSLSVREGTGGMKPLDDDDRANIAQTINDEVLTETAVTFHTTSVSATDNGRYDVTGDLELADRANEISFELALDERGHVTGTAVVTQTRWGMKPYSALFGTLKVADDVIVSIDGRLNKI